MTNMRYEEAFPRRWVKVKSSSGEKNISPANSSPILPPYDDIVYVLKVDSGWMVISKRQNRGYILSIYTLTFTLSKDPSILMLLSAHVAP